MRAIVRRTASGCRATSSAGFRHYLDCGVVERGFARVVCPTCRYEVLVPFSCKVRGLCPSCDGRRMADGAARLVEQILPLDVDYRQWTLSFPRWLRVRLLRDPTLASQGSVQEEVLGVFVRVVFEYHRRRARTRGIAGGAGGGSDANPVRRLVCQCERAFSHAHSRGCVARASRWHARLSSVAAADRRGGRDARRSHRWQSPTLARSPRCRRCGRRAGRCARKGAGRLRTAAVGGRPRRSTRAARGFARAVTSTPF